MVQTRSASSSVAPRATPSTPAAATAKPRGAPRSSSSSSPLTAAAAGAGVLLTHAPSTAALAWLAVSLPLVAWDTGYVLLRPHSMPGGRLHWPLWKPYDLYGRVDHIYGWKHWDAGNGFTAAQGTLNLVESLMYLGYLLIWAANARPVAGAPAGQRGVVTGRTAAAALLLVFSALVMTVSKTVLYWLNESYSGFDNIGHNPWLDLCVLWIVPNGAWLVVPSYLIYTYATEIIDGLTASPGPATVKTE